MGGAEVVRFLASTSCSGGAVRRTGRPRGSAVARRRRLHPKAAVRVSDRRSARPVDGLDASVAHGRSPVPWFRRPPRLTSPTPPSARRPKGGVPRQRERRFRSGGGVRSSVARRVPGTLWTVGTRASRPGAITALRAAGRAACHAKGLAFDARKAVPQLRAVRPGGADDRPRRHQRPPVPAPGSSNRPPSRPSPGQLQLQARRPSRETVTRPAATPEACLSHVQEGA